MLFPFIKTARVLALTLALSSLAIFQSQAQSNLLVRIMAANTTSGNFQSYEGPGIRIFQGLKPDVVAIQEFQNHTGTLRALVDTAFGTNFDYYVEPSGNIPNGIVSRWPITRSGSVPSPFVSDRGFAWAEITLPGTTNKLGVISAHLYGSGSASQRGTEANVIKAIIQTNFPAGAWVVVGGDMNTGSRDEAAIVNFTTILSDDPQPSDSITGGSKNTNEPRSKPYDYVLPTFSLDAFRTSTVLPSVTFTNGLVFDSDVYSPLSDVSPVQSGDSHVTGMQHMAVIKDFLLPISGGTTITNAPSITAQPQPLTVPLSSNATFTVTASGTAPLSYQWCFYGTNLTGATTTSYTRTNAQSADAGPYTVVVTNIAGSVTSSPAQLTINSAPFITSQPQNLTVSAGNDATFTVAASGESPLSYQWRFAGTNIANATATSYTRTNAQLADAGNYTVVVTNNSGSVTSSIAVLTVNSVSGGGSATNVVISQIYGGGGNASASFQNDFVELFNPTASAINISTWSVQYAAATGTTWSKANLTGSIQPYRYYLVQLAAGGTTSPSLPTPDATGGMNMSASQGKVALVKNQTALSGSSPIGNANLVDFVGFGSADAFEGSAAAPGAPTSNNTTSVLRKNGGYTDSNTNVNDFVTLTPPAPRNSSSPANPPATPPTPASAPSLSVTGLTGNQFSFALTGTAGSNYIVQASADLSVSNWTSLRTNAAPYTFADTNVATFPQRFYRAILAP